VDATHIHPLHGEPPSSLAQERLRLALIVVTGLLAAEFITGVLAHSLALLGDAGHLGTDLVTLGLAWLAGSRARRRATAERTFGFHRTGILVALVNGALLMAVAGTLAAAAIARLRAPTAVSGLPVVALGAAALVVNGWLATLLATAGRELSVRSAALHVGGDALASAGVVVGGLLVLAAGWSRADAAVGLGIAVLIAGGGARVLREAVAILAEGTPRDIDVTEVRSAMLAEPAIRDVHDLHVWSLDRRHRALTAHVTVADLPLSEVTAMLRRVEILLCRRFAIEHATLQPEWPPCADTPDLHCHLDERHATHNLTSGSAT
jgi:cobalt-zinc-cadmium efflux system protein